VIVALSALRLSRRGSGVPVMPVRSECCFGGALRPRVTGSSTVSGVGVRRPGAACAGKS
jgi:hypothetical protein